MKHDGNDLLRRQDCINAIEEITSSMVVCVNTDECHGMKRMQRQAVIELANMPAVQPDHVADISKKVDGDCISRQAAIDALDCINGVEEVLRSLPSVQQEIIRCKNCKFSHMTNDGRYCKYCDQFTDDYGELVEMYFDSNFYCGYAERKTDE